MALLRVTSNGGGLSMGTEHGAGSGKTGSWVSPQAGANGGRPGRRAVRAAGRAALCLLAAWLAGGRAGEARAGPPSLEELIGKAVKAIDDASQYTYVLKQRDRLLPGDEFGPEATLEVKFRRPNDIYLKTVAGPDKGRQVLYSPETTQGKILGHEPWMRWPLRSVSVDPLGSQAMKYTHRPITEAEVGFCIRVLQQSMEKDQRLRREDPAYVPMKAQGPEEVVENGIPLYRFKVVPPEMWHSYTAAPDDKTLFDIARKLGVQVNCLIYYNPEVDDITDFSPGDRLRAPYYCGSAGEFWLYRDTFFLYRQRITDWYGNLYEDYRHLDVRLGEDAGLTDRDFDPENKDYAF